jgi:hypothetical protein
LVEIVQAERTCEGVDELDVAEGGRDDVCEIQSEEICFADYCSIVDVTDFDLGFVSLGRMRGEGKRGIRELGR